MIENARILRAGLAAALFLAGSLAGSAQDSIPDSSALSEATQAPSDPPPASVRLPENINEAVGTWEMALEGSNRRCTLTFAGESGPNGRILRFPAGCRRALPLLAKIDGWLFADKGIRLVDKNVRPLLAFEPGTEPTTLGAKAESGERYTLAPIQIAAAAGAALSAETVTDAPTAPGAPSADLTPAAMPLPTQAQGHSIPGAQPTLAADRLTVPDVPLADRPGAGIYALDRFNNKDVCRLSLDARPPPPVEASLLKPTAIAQPDDDTAPVRILPGCRDNGIAVFDPATWSYADGRLTLKARRGHAVNLVFKGEGRWRREPDVGTTLELRRVEP